MKFNEEQRKQINDTLYHPTMSIPEMIDRIESILSQPDAERGKEELSASLRPATVSEDEIQKKTEEYHAECLNAMHEEQAILLMESHEHGIRWALGRQTRIVLPSYRVTRDIESSAVNRCLDEIKQLNPSATFVTGQK